jgi:hypothetical protein
MRLSMLWQKVVIVSSPILKVKELICLGRT